MMLNHDYEVFNVAQLQSAWSRDEMTQKIKGKIERFSRAATSNRIICMRQPCKISKLCYAVLARVCFVLHQLTPHHRASLSFQRKYSHDSPFKY